MTTTCSTHVLDSTSGRPAVGMEVRLTTSAGDLLAVATTDDDGRVRFDADLDAGTDGGAHRLTFGTGAWFAARGDDCFHPEVAVAFTATADEHHHVALLLSPFAYTTYRGS